MIYLEFRQETMVHKPRDPMRKHLLLFYREAPV